MTPPAAARELGDACVADFMAHVEAVTPADQAVLLSVLIDCARLAMKSRCGEDLTDAMWRTMRWTVGAREHGVEIPAGKKAPP